MEYERDDTPKSLLVADGKRSHRLLCVRETYRSIGYRSRVSRFRSVACVRVFVLRHPVRGLDRGIVSMVGMVCELGICHAYPHLLAVQGASRLCCRSRLTLTRSR